MRLNRGMLEVCSAFDLRKLLRIVGISFRHSNTICALPRRIKEGFIYLTSTAAIWVRGYVIAYLPYPQYFALIKETRLIGSTCAA
jgi:hypothetical protein